MRQKIISRISFCLAVIFSFLSLFDTQNKKAAEREYESLQSEYTASTGSDEREKEQSSSTDSGMQEFPQFDVDTAELQKLNSDFCMWLIYPDAGISLPIVHESSDRIDYYLNHTISGQKSPVGCLFISSSESADITSGNTVIHGHNMRDGSMFGGLKNIVNDPKTYCTNPYFFLFDKSGRKMKFRVFAVYTVDKSSSMYVSPETQNEYENYIQKAINLGGTENIVPFTDSEKRAVKNQKPLVTLSTCYGIEGTSKRTLVQGILIQTES